MALIQLLSTSHTAQKYVEYCYSIVNSCSSGLLQLIKVDVFLLLCLFFFFKILIFFFFSEMYRSHMPLLSKSRCSNYFKCVIILTSTFWEKCMAARHHLM